MKTIFTNIREKASKLLLLTVLAGAIASCDSVLNFEEGDCDIKYRVKFKYDYHMKQGVDAFAQEVKTVTLYAFDDNGNFVYQKTEEGEPLADGSYSMEVEINPQKYHLVTWAGLDDESFAVPVMTGESEITELTVLTLRDPATRAAEGEEDKYIVKKNLSPLFHGEAIKGKSVLYTTPTTGNGIREEVTTIGLMKNTNNIRIVIAQVNKNPEKPVASARAIKADMFTYAIYDDNGKMNYDNSLLEDNLLTYQPFITETDKVTTRAFSSEKEGAETYPAAVAEISVARLMETQDPKLKIYNKETKTELLPDGALIRYLGLLKEQNCINMPLQEYLDRQDTYGIIFFVDENLTLINSVIQINDWVIQLNDFDM